MRNMNLYLLIYKVYKLPSFSVNTTYISVNIIFIYKNTSYIYISISCI